MTRNLNVYVVKNETQMKEVAPLIPFPMDAKDKILFHKEELCSQILDLLNEYIDLLNEQETSRKMSPKQELIYFNIQEKILLLDKYDIEVLMNQPIVKQLYTIEGNHELESFMFLVKQWLIPDESNELEWKIPKKTISHK